MAGAEQLLHKVLSRSAVTVLNGTAGLAVQALGIYFEVPRAWCTQACQKVTS